MDGFEIMPSQFIQDFILTIFILTILVYCVAFQPTHIEAEKLKKLN